MKYIFLYIFVFTYTATAYTQAALEITLIDSLSQPIADEAIIISNEAIGYHQTELSNTQGKVRLSGLSTSGQYQLIVQESARFKGQQYQGLRLYSNQTKSVTLRLQANTLSIAPVVLLADGRQTINSVDAEVASELSAEELQVLPVEGRDITRALYRLPNVSQATGFFTEAPNVAINGANPLYTNYQIDGLDNNENFLGGQRFAMPVGFTDNITVLTNNFSAEHGLTSNGIVNLTTKSGTNEVHGEAFYITRPGAVLDAASPFAQRDLSGNQVKDGFQRHQFGVGVGAPLVKDRTFLFVNFEQTFDQKDNLLNASTLNINETVRGTNSFTLFSAKLDQHWTNAFRSSLRLNTGKVFIERQGGGLDGGVAFPSAGNQQDRNSLNIALKNTYQGKNFTYEANYQFGRFRWNYANPQETNSPDVTVEAPDGTVAAVLGHPGYVFDELEESHVVQQKFTWYTGSHRLKVGGQLRSSGYRLLGGGNPNGSYRVRLNNTQLAQLQQANLGSNLSIRDIPSDVQVINYAIELRPQSFGKRQNIWSVYLEDRWNVSPKWTLTYGLRYDYDNLSKGGGDQGDLNNLAPRFSANYQINAHSALRAGYGIYYDKILYAVYSDALQFNSTSADYQAQLAALQAQGILPADANLAALTHEGTLVGNLPNTSYLQGPNAEQLQGQRDAIFQNELRILNPEGYDNPYSHQIMLGYQYKVNPNTLLYVDVMHNRSHNLFRIRNLNAASAYPIDPDNVTVRSSEDADATRPVPVYSDAAGSYALVGKDTLRGAARNVVVSETAGRSNYYALNFTLQKDRGESNYALRLMYTLSFLENNTEDINFRAMDANQFDNEWGPSINDRTHLINGIVSYYPIKGLTLTLATLLQSGQPINRIPDAQRYGTSDLNGDGRGFGDAYVGNSDRAPGETRNNDRLPWSTTFDLSVFYTLKVYKTQRIEFGAQVFNIFNAENWSGYSNNATQSNQVQVGRANSGQFVARNAAPPRQFQFSLRYLF